MEPDQSIDNPFIILGHLYPDTARAFARRVGMSLSRVEVLHQLMHAGELSQAELQQRQSALAAAAQLRGQGRPRRARQHPVAGQLQQRRVQAEDRVRAWEALATLPTVRRWSDGVRV